MQETEHPTLELQKEHWKYWNLRPEHPYEDGFLRPLRRGENPGLSAIAPPRAADHPGHGLWHGMVREPACRVWPDNGH